MCLDPVNEGHRAKNAPDGASGASELGGGSGSPSALAGAGARSSAEAGEGGAPNNSGAGESGAPSSVAAGAGGTRALPDTGESGASGEAGARNDAGAGSLGDAAGGRGTAGGTGVGSGGAAGTVGFTLAAGTHWVGTWTASPYYDSSNQPPSSLSGSVLRQVAHVSLGGTKLRVQFSNLSGNGPVTINAAHLARCTAAPAVDSTIDTTTDKGLTFAGSPAVTIAKGAEIWSDPVDFSVPALGNISITTAFGTVPSNVVGHSGSRTNSYLQTGSSAVDLPSMTSAVKTAHWYYISGIDVVADASAASVVAIGDSITDGRGSDTDENDRWTDVLAARLAGNAETASVALLNQGIGATNLIGSAVTAAQARFNRDVLGQSGVRYAIVLDGVNDIGGGASTQSLTNAYADLISRAHAAGVLIYGGTITPFGGNSYYTAAHETVRQEVNTYIRSGAFDGYIDFDAALTDGGDPPKLQATYAAWSQADGLHPGPAGYQAMGGAADLELFTE
jgi:lysophospholipase L1-like esterase